MSKDPFEAVINSGTKQEQEKTGEKGEERVGLEAFDQLYEKPKKKRKVAKNMYLDIENAEWIEKQAKKAGKSDSVYVNELLVIFRGLGIGEK